MTSSIVNRVWPIGVALALLVACDEKAETPPPVVAVETGGPYACRYENHFTEVNECRAYYSD